jgi:hypothetical protein
MTLSGKLKNVIHTIKFKKVSSMVIKLDFSKAYDQTCWLYVRLLFIHVGFSLTLVN